MRDDPRILEYWRAAWTPPERVAPWQWAERNVEAVPASPIPGRFNSANSPMIRDVMDAVVDPRVRTVSVMAAIQAGKTLAPSLALCYVVANLPGPTLWLDQTDASARDVAESRLFPLFENCPPVAALFPKDKNKKRRSTIIFANGMTLWMLGAHSKTNLQSRSIRWLIGDETWKWPPGHMREAEARVSAFGWLGKCVFMSQGGWENDDTDKKFRTSDQREWCYTCPECGNAHPFRWDCVEWPADARLPGSWNYARVRRETVLRCPTCGARFPDTDVMRRTLNARGKFVRTNHDAAPEVVGFHWNALAVRSWGELAEMYLRAKAAARKGDNSDLVIFHQKQLGEPWRADDDEVFVPNLRAGYNLGDDWAETAEYCDVSFRWCAAGTAQRLWARAEFLTVDVQLDHFYCVIRAWSITGASRLVWAARVNTYDQIAALQAQFKIPPQFVFIDYGAFSNLVAAAAAKRGWYLLKGDDNKDGWEHNTRRGKFVRPYKRVQKIETRSGCAKLYVFSALLIKNMLYALRRNASGATWEIPADAFDEYVKMLSSERYDKEKNMWVQVKEANHYFDCEAMQVFAANLHKLIGKESVSDFTDFQHTDEE